MRMSTLQVLEAIEPRPTGSMIRPPWRELWLPLAIFGASRLVSYALGVRFFDGHLGRMMPFIDVDLLRHDLLRSLWLLDGQPPGFNLFLGLVLKSGPLSRILFPATFLIVGTVVAGGIYLLLRWRGCSRGFSTIVSTLFTISPATLLYENYLFYTYPVAGLLVLCCIALHHALESHGARAWLLFWTALGAVCLVRSAFHIVVMIVVLCGALLLWRERRRVLLASAALSLLVVSSVSAKNLLLYGSFSSSAWLGVSLAPLTVEQLPRREGRRWLAQGRLTPVAFVQRFSPIQRFRRAMAAFQPNRSTDDHPLRRRETKLGGDINYHHAVYSAAARAYLQDAWAVIRARPDLYLRAVGKAYLLYTTSPAEWRPLDSLRSQLSGYGGSLPRLTTLRLGESRAGLPFLLIPLLLLVAARDLWLVAFRGRREPARLVRVFALFLVAYVTFVGSFLDYGENNRFRFMIEPLLYVETAALLRRALRSCLPRIFS